MTFVNDYIELKRKKKKKNLKSAREVHLKKMKDEIRETTKKRWKRSNEKRWLSKNKADNERCTVTFWTHCIYIYIYIHILFE